VDQRAQKLCLVWTRQFGRQPIHISGAGMGRSGPGGFQIAVQYLAHGLCTQDILLSVRLHG
jgi:hypothetical protein